MEMYDLQNYYKSQCNNQVADATSHTDTEDYVDMEDLPNKETENVKEDVKTYRISMGRNLVIFVLAIVLAVALVAVSVTNVLMFIKISAFDSSMCHCERQLNESLQRNCDMDEEFLDSPDTNVSYLFSRLLSDIEEVFTSSLENKLQRMSDMSSPTSCADVLYRNSSSPSGYYVVRSSTGQLVSVYCDMTRTCGSITGGWMRVAELDVDYCFTGFKPMSFNGTKTCITSEDTAGCSSVQFSSFNIQYTKVCGKVRGYGIGTLDGFHRIEKFRSVRTDIYLDGVSVSSNDGRHIWSFAADRFSNCGSKPAFVGTDWTCDKPLCTTDSFCSTLLWNTSFSGNEGYFLKQFLGYTNADVTMKVCRDEERSNEDIALSEVELYLL